MALPDKCQDNSQLSVSAQQVPIILLSGQLPQIFTHLPHLLLFIRCGEDSSEMLTEDTVHSELLNR